MYKPEILAPCGDYNSVIFSINAGADAVYLGGPSFSARAYAKNLSIEEIISAIKYAHLNNAKVYLTLNTLIKNEEIVAALELIKPLYENNLDAIIIQDLGLLYIIPVLFPGLDIHVSTQMSIMSRLGVRFLSKHGVTRVVPARELSYKEIEMLKKEGLEIECFIHGAMCYSYSGKCLFSSVAGGRSGNRGRCAGPCRKPYDVIDEDGHVIKTNVYPLSMKDMCTINSSKALIDCKVDSFKIEGRMKSKEYSGIVSSIYKKYSNEYIKNKSINVSKKDMNLLSNLYVRSNLQEGYLNKHNGKDMISMTNPAYNQVKDDMLDELRDQYEDMKTFPVEMVISVFADTNISGSATYKDISVNITGPLVSKALKNPLTEETIGKQMCKLGNTFFRCNDLQVYTDGESFISMGQLNEFRRNLIDELENAIFSKRDISKCTDISSVLSDDVCLNKKFSINLDINEDNCLKSKLIIGIDKLEQLKAFRDIEWDSAFIIDLFSNIFESNKLNKNDNIYLRLPPIIRDNKIDFIENRLKSIISKYDIKGIYVNSIDGLYIAGMYFDKDKIYGDTGLYAFNDYASTFLYNYVNEITCSYENNEKELRRFNDNISRQIVIYGYIPLMYSANCIASSVKACNKSCSGMYIRDDSRRTYYSKCNHDLCYNTLYNNVPLSLFSELDKLDGRFSALRLEFTYESYEETLEVMNCLKNKNNFSNRGNNSHTLGHYRRGVE